MAAERKEAFYRFAVNPLGELIRSTDPDRNNDQWLGGEGVNIGSVAHEVLSPADYDTYSEFNMDSPEWKAISRYVDQCVQHQFYIDAYEDLSLPEFDFYCQVSDLQRLNNSRFRIWGEMHADSFDAEGRKAWLVTSCRSSSSSAWTSGGIKLKSCSVNLWLELPNSFRDSQSLFGKRACRTINWSSRGAVASAWPRINVSDD